MELHSYPIFSADWGADEELLLLEGVSLQGIGNWQAIAEHVGTRAKDEIEKHYNEVYVDSPDWPLPVSQPCHSQWFYLIKYSLAHGPLI